MLVFFLSFWRKVMGVVLTCVCVLVGIRYYLCVREGRVSGCLCVCVWRGNACVCVCVKEVLLLSSAGVCFGASMCRYLH